MKKVLISVSVCQWFFASLLLLGLYTPDLQAQTGTETRLQFKDYSLESGLAKSEGAVYRFAGVSNGVDALVTVRRIENAALVDLDLSRTGTNDAFQPNVRVINRPAGGGVGYVDFDIQLVTAGTSSPTEVQTFWATPVDVDGLAPRTRESAGLSMSDFYILERASLLDVSSEDNLYLFSCRTAADAPGIRTTATDNMASVLYQNRSAFTFRAKVFADAYPSNIDEDAATRLFSLSFDPSLPKSYRAATSFPVELISFTGNIQGDRIELNWRTASELNNAYFAVERSQDGKAFTTLGEVAGMGTTETLSSYRFQDLNPLAGSAYYRLRQVDFDGQETILSTIELNTLSEGLQVKAYPNPVQHVLTLSLQDASDIQQIELLNLRGQAVRIRPEQTQPQTWRLPVDHLAPGVYILRISARNGMVHTQRITVS